MLHILLLILKILGIILFVILGILLLLLLLVLLVPVRYRGDAAFDGKPTGSASVSWLFHLLRVRVSYDGKLRVCAKALWFRLFEQTLWPEEETDEIAAETGGGETGNTVRDDGGGSGEKTAGGAADGGSEEKIAGGAADRDGEEKTAGGADDGGCEEKIAGGADDRDGKEKVADKAGEEKATAGEGVPGNDRAPLEDLAEEREDLEPAGRAPQEEKAGPAPGRILSLLKKLWQTLSELAAKIRRIFENADETRKSIQRKYEALRAFLSDEENQKTFGLLIRQAKAFFRHILPRRIKGFVRFGFDDPYRTGQVLTAISPFYGLYAKTVKVEPVFEEKALEGELHIKGHIRAATLLAIAVRIFLNKNFRRLLRKWRK